MNTTAHGLHQAKEAARTRMDEAIRQRETIKAALRDANRHIKDLQRDFERARDAWLARVEGGAS